MYILPRLPLSLQQYAHHDSPFFRVDIRIQHFNICHRGSRHLMQSTSSVAQFSGFSNGTSTFTSLHALQSSCPNPNVFPLHLTSSLASLLPPDLHPYSNVGVAGDSIAAAAYDDSVSVRWSEIQDALCGGWDDIIMIVCEQSSAVQICKCRPIWRCRMRL
jgi:hypothetical protein